MLTGIEQASLRMKNGEFPHQKTKKGGMLRSALYVTGGLLLACYLLLSQLLLSFQTATQEPEVAPAVPAELAFNRGSDLLVLENDGENELGVIGGPINETDEYENRRILDQVARDELPIIYPITFLATDGNCFGEVVHAKWPKATGKALRRYGVGPDAKDPPDGETVKGDWPDLLEKLTYVPILKNGHTSLANAFGDLRQRLNGSSELLKWTNGNQGRMIRPIQKTGTQDPPKPASWMSWAFGKTKKVTRAVVAVLPSNPPINEAYSSLLSWAEKNPEHPHKFFTVLRDPIDRFISATCEELRQGEPYRTRCLHPHWNDTLSCTIQYLPTATGANSNLLKFKPHQELQTKQLHMAVRGKNVGIAVIPFTSLAELMNELGCSTHSEKVRDRASSLYTNTTSRARIGPNNMTPQMTKHHATAVFSALASFREMVRKKRNEGRRRRLTPLALDEIRAQNHVAKEKSYRIALRQKQEKEQMARRHQSDAINEHTQMRRVPLQKAPMLTAATTEVKAARMRNAKGPPPRSVNYQNVPNPMDPTDKAAADRYLSEFCQIHAEDLSEGQLHQLCDIYHRDVELMESVGMAVPHCSKYLAKVGRRGFQVELRDD